MEIQNRRYIGNKHKLTGDIEKIICDFFGGATVTIADLFAGTGVVGYHLAKKGHGVIMNDILCSNVVAYNAWLSDAEVNENRVAEILREFNNLNPASLKKNYFSEIYGGKYYSENNAKAIGYIRDEIENRRTLLPAREYFILLASLLYYADRIANTVGHFEHYLKSTPTDKALNLRTLKIEKIKNAQILNQDANELAREITCDAAYIDPPYNARQYVNFYHVLENLARWDKPTEFEGASMKFKRNHLKSGYSRVKAPALFSELINALQCRLIIVSYNNTYSAKSTSSVNRIPEETLVEILQKRGRVSVNEISYKAFSVGTTAFKNHMEKLYVCEVRG